MQQAADVLRGQSSGDAEVEDLAYVDTLPEVSNILSYSVDISDRNRYLQSNIGRMRTW